MITVIPYKVEQSLVKLLDALTRYVEIKIEQNKR